MTSVGQRKAALYLSSLAADEQRLLLSALPADAASSLKPLLATIAANGWNHPELVGRALAEDIRGLTAQTSLSIDGLLELVKSLPPDMTARLFAANVAMDAKFMLALLDAPSAKAVQLQLSRVPVLPTRLKDALLAEAQASVQVA